LNVSANGGTAGYTYAWSPGGQTTALVTDVDAGNYSVTVTDANGCSDSFSTVVTNLPAAPVTITASTTFVLAGDSVQLQAGGSESYSWSPGSGLSCIACVDPIAVPLQPVTYTVIATDENGCTSTAQIAIDVEVKCGLLFVPTIFSPNKQGLAVNEQVCVLGSCIDIIDFKIYDRWGKIVFESEDPQMCWDGTVDGKDAPGGVYVYSMKAILTNGSVVTSSGNITLVR
jgi:gliding motility-associated-like protein